MPAPHCSSTPALPQRCHQAHSLSPEALRVACGVTQPWLCSCSKRLSQLLAQLAANPRHCCVDPADILSTCCNQSTAYLFTLSLAGCLLSRGISRGKKQKPRVTAVPTHWGTFASPFSPEHHLWQAGSSSVLPSTGPEGSWQQKQWIICWTLTCDSVNVDSAVLGTVLKAVRSRTRGTTSGMCSGKGLLWKIKPHFYTHN